MTQRVTMLGLLLATLPLAAPPAAAEIAVSLDPQGRLQVGAEAGAHARRFDPARALPATPRSKASRATAVGSGRHTPLIHDVASEHGLDPALLHAMVEIESGHRPDARSPKGALGLMQVMPATGRRFGVSDLLDPEQNLRAGARYLRWLQGHFQGDLVLMLAAYNAGEGAVRKYGNRVPPYAETRQYVERVLLRYRGG